MVRILTALIGLPLLILIVWLKGWILAISIAIVTLIALYEYVKALGLHGNLAPSFFILSILSLLILYLMKFDYYALPVGILISVFTSILYEILSKQSSFVRATESIFFILYVPVMFGYLMLFENIVDGAYTIWLCFIAPFVTDTFAFLGGKLIGGKKLTSISPNKTISGSITGIIASTLAFVLYGYVLQKYFQINLSFYIYPILGALASIVSQVGDLCASLIKRTYGVKDFGNILPGHGGILDRFDSVIFTIPVIYFFTFYFLG